MIKPRQFCACEIILENANIESVCEHASYEGFFSRMKHLVKAFDGEFTPFLSEEYDVSVQLKSVKLSDIWSCRQ